MQCPSCRLLNPPNAIRCDCGYDFATHTAEQPPPLTMPKKKLNRRELARQYALSCGIGLLVMLFLSGIVFILGVHSSSPWKDTILIVLSPGFWVVMKTFPPGPQGYANPAADVGANLAMYLIDSMLWGVVILIGWRTVISLR